MSAIKIVDEASVEKKLLSVKSTQESIQCLSLWALHHKAQHENIVKVWFNVLKQSKTPRRLTLFYVCNEIVQTCKRKHAIMYKDAFKEVLREAAMLVRDNSVKGNIERIFSIWEERSIYDSEFVEDLIATLNNTKIRPSAAKLLAEFKPSKLRESVAGFAKVEKDCDAKRRRLSSLNLDVTSQNYMKLLKDRSHGKQYTQQIDDAHHHLDDYVSSIEKELKDRNALLDLLEQSEFFYDAQHGEAKIVANAYKTFGTRVANLRKKMDDVRKTLPDPLSPVPSPSMDAPSPAESVAEETEDNTETVDMEMSDGEEEEGQKSYNVGNATPMEDATISKSVTDNYPYESAPQNEPLIKPLIGNTLTLPSAPDDLESPSNSPLVRDPPAPARLPLAIDYNSTFLPSASLSTFSLRFGGGGGTANDAATGDADSSTSAPEDDGSDDDDDGRGTPVQDEKPEMSAPPGGGACDPIALLNELLNKTKKQTTTNTDFLKSLSVLTQSMNVPFRSPENDGKVDGDVAASAASSSPAFQTGDNDQQAAAPPQFRPFYHSEDYLAPYPHSAQANAAGADRNGALPFTTPYADSNYNFSSAGMTRPPPPPPPPPPSYGFPAASTGHYEGQDEEEGFYGRTEKQETTLHIRPDLVEMLKNVLNNAKAPVGPDAVVATPHPQSQTTLQQPPPPRQQQQQHVVQEFPPCPDEIEPRANDADREFVERLKRRTGYDGAPPFRNAPDDPSLAASPEIFAQMLGSDQQQQRMHGFVADNDFVEQNRIEPRFFVPGGYPPRSNDGGESYGGPPPQGIGFLARQPVPPGHRPRSPGPYDDVGNPMSMPQQVMGSNRPAPTPGHHPRSQAPYDEDGNLMSMQQQQVMGSNRMDIITRPEMPTRHFRPEYRDEERHMEGPPHQFDRFPGGPLGHSSDQRFFNVQRHRFPSDFNRMSRPNNRVGRPSSRFPGPKRFPSGGGFYPRY